MEDLLGPKDVARILGISERGATRLLASGKLPALRVGKLWRTSQARLTRYVEAEIARYGDVPPGLRDAA